MAENAPTRGRGAWVRALARRMRAWADAVLADEAGDVPPRPEPAPVEGAPAAAPGSTAAPSPGLAQADAASAGPPEHWLRAVQSGRMGPPADWVARVRKGAPHLLEDLAREGVVLPGPPGDDVARGGAVRPGPRGDALAREGAVRPEVAAPTEPPAPARPAPRPVLPRAPVKATRAPVASPGEVPAVRLPEPPSGGPLSSAREPSRRGPGLDLSRPEPSPRPPAAEPLAPGPGLDLSRPEPSMRPPAAEPFEPGPGAGPRSVLEDGPSPRPRRAPTASLRSTPVLRSVPPPPREERAPEPVPAPARTLARPRTQEPSALQHRVQVLSIDGDTVKARESWEPPGPRAPRLAEERGWEVPAWTPRSEAPALEPTEAQASPPESHPWPELPPAPRAERAEVLVELRQWERLRRLEREQRGE